MSSLESRQAFTQPEIVEKKAKKERFAARETHIPGVLLRTEPDVDVDILRKTIDELYAFAKDYVPRKFQIDELTKQQEQPDREIKTLAKAHEGLRGIESKPDTFVLNVFPSDKVSWDRELLKKSLGIAAYSSVVHEDVDITILVPAGFPTEEGPIQEELLHQVLTQALLDLGLTQEDLDKVMSTRINHRVDEKILENMIKNGQVSLLEGTKQTSRTWTIHAKPL